MKVKLTKDQLRYIEITAEHSLAANFLRKYQSMKFAVGDIVNKKQMHFDDDEKPVMIPEYVSSKHKVVRKYMCVHEDEFGVPSFVQINIDGKLSDTVISLYDCDLKLEAFVLDDSYVMHKMLSDGEEYNPLETYKAAKKFRLEAIQKNKPLLIDYNKSYEDRIKLIDSLSVGQEIWMARSAAYLDSDAKYVVKKINTYTYKQVEKIIKPRSRHIYSGQWLMERWIENAPKIKKLREQTHKTYKEVILEDRFGDEDIISYEDVTDKVSTTKPFPMEEGDL